MSAKIRIDLKVVEKSELKRAVLNAEMRPPNVQISNSFQIILAQKV
jgi:hypothetical protein